MITKQEVEHIAKLARLELNVTEKEKMQKDLSTILDYFDLLKKLKDKAERVFLTGNKAVLRQDKTNVLPEFSREELLASVPEKEKKHIKVKAIF